MHYQRLRIAMLRVRSGYGPVLQALELAIHASTLLSGEHWDDDSRRLRTLP